MITMTYGTMPSRENFDFALIRENAESGYKFNNDSRVGTCVLTADQLWKELQEALFQYNQGDNWLSTIDYDKDDFELAEVAGNWCSCVLETLGFEWV